MENTLKTKAKTVEKSEPEAKAKIAELFKDVDEVMELDGEESK